MLRLLSAWNVFDVLTAQVELTGPARMIVSMIAVLLCAVVAISHVFYTKNGN